MNMVSWSIRQSCRVPIVGAHIKEDNITQYARTYTQTATPISGSKPLSVVLRVEAVVYNLRAPSTVSSGRDEMWT